MEHRYRPLSPDTLIPPVILGLREEFGRREEEFHTRADHLYGGMKVLPSHLMHIPFTWEGYSVKAMYDPGQERFTSLEACRDIELDERSPEYSLSIILELVQEYA